jgi:alpha-1,3-glucosyltransferase
MHVLLMKMMIRLNPYARASYFPACCSAVFFPAIAFAVSVFSRLGGSKQQHSVILFGLTVALLQPALLLIDHLHFQYNCISLGLCALAAAAIAADYQILGSICYCLALNHKQMSLFYAPAFFGHLLGRCLQQKTWPGKVGGGEGGQGVVMSTCCVD